MSHRPGLDTESEAMLGPIPWMTLRNAFVSVLIVAGDSRHQRLWFLCFDVTKEARGCRPAERRRSPALMEDDDGTATDGVFKISGRMRHDPILRHGHTVCQPPAAPAASRIASGHGSQCPSEGSMASAVSILPSGTSSAWMHPASSHRPGSASR